MGSKYEKKIVTTFYRKQKNTDVILLLQKIIYSGYIYLFASIYYFQFNLVYLWYRDRRGAKENRYLHS